MLHMYLFFLSVAWYHTCAVLLLFPKDKKAKTYKIKKYLGIVTFK